MKFSRNVNKAMQKYLFEDDEMFFIFNKLKNKVVSKNVTRAEAHGKLESGCIALPMSDLDAYVDALEDAEDVNENKRPGDSTRSHFLLKKHGFVNQVSDSQYHHKQHGMVEVNQKTGSWHHIGHKKGNISYSLQDHLKSLK